MMRPIDPEKMRAMEYASRDLGKVLGRVLEEYFAKSGEKWGFGLFIFSFEGPEFTWISNAKRADMVKTMQEFISRNPPDVTSEGRN
jgi:hypothetical protein